LWIGHNVGRKSGTLTIDAQVHATREVVQSTNEPAAAENVDHNWDHK
jgi:hypothetical protein